MTTVKLFITVPLGGGGGGGSKMARYGGRVIGVLQYL